MSNINTPFEDHIKDFNLVQERNVNVPSVDFASLECTISKGGVYINRAIVDTMKIVETDGLAVHIGAQAGAVVFGLTVYRGNPKDAIIPKLLKKKPSTVNIAPLMMKYNLSTKKDYKIDLIDCGEYYLVFAILAPVVVKEERTAPFGEVQAPTEGGGMESVPEWSDF